MLSDTEFKGEGPAPSGSGPPLVLGTTSTTNIIINLMGIKVSEVFMFWSSLRVPRSNIRKGYGLHNMEVLVIVLIAPNTLY